MFRVVWATFPPTLCFDQAAPGIGTKAGESRVFVTRARRGRPAPLKPALVTYRRDMPGRPGHGGCRRRTAARPSFAKMLAVCLAIARSVTTSCPAAAALDRPCAISSRTSRYRGVSLVIGDRGAALVDGSPWGVSVFVIPSGRRDNWVDCRSRIGR